MLIALYIYCGFAGAVALRLGWCMATELDHYDWKYNTGEIWGMLLTMTLLSPLIVFNPKLLLNPVEIFKPSLIDFAASDRRRDQFWDNPPPCSSVIRYCQGKARYDDTYGEFLFSADDLERHLSSSLSSEDKEQRSNHASLLRWLQQRDKDDKTPVDIPDECIGGFKYTADYMIKNGFQTRSYCQQCQKELQPADIQTDDFYPHGDWRFFQLACPEGHSLHLAEHMHFHFRRS